MKPLNGLWITDPSRKVLCDDYLGRLKDLGFDSISVMIDKMSERWDPTWRRSHIQRLCSMAIDHDLEVVLTVWPSPNVPQINRMMGDLSQLIRFGAVGVELDVEGLWYVQGGDGRRSLHPGYEECGEYLMDRILSICDPSDVRVELTTHLGHREMTEDAVMAPRCHRLVPQAYSVARGPNGLHYSWGHKIRGPGHAQRLAKKLSERVEGYHRLSMGLAAWYQNWPGHTVKEAMQVAYDAALEAEPFEIKWWDSRHLLASGVYIPT